MHYKFKKNENQRILKNFKIDLCENHFFIIVLSQYLLKTYLDAMEILCNFNKT